jgi:phosphoglycerate dehydrogenase-like enzyme
MKVKVSNLAFSNNVYLVEQLKKEFEDVEINSSGMRLNDDALVDYFFDAECVVVGLELITAEILDRLPNLKIIAKYGVGLDNIDLKACKERGIIVGWTGGVNKRSVAEISLGFMLALSRNLYLTSNQLKASIWNKVGGDQLSGKTIGILGCGNIGKELIKLLSPFQCNILINDILDMKEFASMNSLECVNKEVLFSNSDIISIHTPLTPETNNLFNINVFEKMKAKALLINTARGGIVNETDLKIALQTNLIAGAALDVYESEPPSDQELLLLPNVICTPHIGGNSYEAVVAMGLSAISHLVNYKKIIKKQGQKYE